MSKKTPCIINVLFSLDVSTIICSFRTHLTVNIEILMRCVFEEISFMVSICYDFIVHRKSVYFYCSPIKDKFNNQLLSIGNTYDNCTRNCRGFCERRKVGWSVMP